MSTATHILVVEDEEHLAVVIKYNLEAEGYRVSRVADGPAALQLLEDDDTVDLVILDIMMPGMSGYTVCETLRDQGKLLPILLLTARTLPEDRARGFDAGANQYLTKPFELDELLSRVKNLLKFRQAAPAERPNATALPRSVQIGEATVDFETHEVTTADGVNTRMTRLELDLLRYFIRHEGRVIPREELLENVWQMPRHVQSRAPDQFIRRLRKTFEPEPSQPRYFVTVREAGYRFVSAGKA